MGGEKFGQRRAVRGVARSQLNTGTDHLAQSFIGDRKHAGFLDGYLVNRNGIAYDNRDIEQDREANEELRRKTGSTGVPVLEIDQCGGPVVLRGALGAWSSDGDTPEAILKDTSLGAGTRPM